MDKAAMVATRDWGCTPLLPLAVSEGGNNTFWASHADDETAEKVSRRTDHFAKTTNIEQSAI